jgi:hypothetical protein
MLVCFVAAAPVENISVVGTNWLQHGDIWDLQVYWNGSAGFEYGFKILSGSYNVTGRISHCCMYIAIWIL